MGGPSLTRAESLEKYEQKHLITMRVKHEECPLPIYPKGYPGRPKEHNGLARKAIDITKTTSLGGQSTHQNHLKIGPH